MKCLIVAAGQGARLREKGQLKPLIEIKGIPLIERVIDRARSAYESAVKIAPTRESARRALKVAHQRLEKLARP